MYFYSKEKLEIMADELNKEFYPERLEKVIPFDAYGFMEKQGLEIEWKYITPNKKLLGMIFFGDAVWPVWDSGKYKKGDYPHNGKYYLLTGVGTNGFMVSAYPIKEKEAIKLKARYKK